MKCCSDSAGLSVKNTEIRTYIFDIDKSNTISHHFRIWTIGESTRPMMRSSS